MHMEKICRKLILSWVAIVVGCTQDGFNVERPLSVPPSAQLVGGLDGWDWIDCKPTSAIHLECKIYDRSGGLMRTSFLRPCLNIRVKDNDVLKVSRMEETVVYFKEINFYEYKPSIIEGESDNSDLAMKYYRMFGVDDNCNFSHHSSELTGIY